MTEDTPRAASRLHLAPLVGQRLAVTGTVVRLGSRPRFADLYEPTLLLAGVQTTDGTPLTDHLWLTLGTRLATVDPQPGDVLAFTARVAPYTKGKLMTRQGRQYAYLRRLDDFTLRYPAQVQVVCRHPAAPVQTAAPVHTPAEPPAPPPPAPSVALPAPLDAAVLDAAVAVASETKPTLTGRILTTIATLQLELGRPPGLSRVIVHSQGAPLNVLRTLRRLAKAQLVEFTHDGAVTLPHC